MAEMGEINRAALANGLGRGGEMAFLFEHERTFCDTDAAPCKSQRSLVPLPLA